MPQLRKYQRFAGQLASFLATGHAEHNRASDNTCGSAGEDGRGIDLFKAELGKQGI